MVVVGVMTYQVAIAQCSIQIQKRSAASQKGGRDRHAARHSLGWSRDQALKKEEVFSAVQVSFSPALVLRLRQLCCTRLFLAMEPPDFTSFLVGSVVMVIVVVVPLGYIVYKNKNALNLKSS